MLNHVRLFVTPWTVGGLRGEPVACQALLCMEFSRHVYWSGFAISTPRDRPAPGMEPVSFQFPTSAGGYFTTSEIPELIIQYYIRESF